MAMANAKMIKTGSFTPTTTSTNYVLDTGSTSWTYLIIVPRVYPYAEGAARCIGIKYINLDAMRMISALGSSSESATAASTASTHIINEDGGVISYSDGVLTFSGTQAQVGRFVAGCVYDWFAW